MFTMAPGLKEQANPEWWMPTKALRLAALLGALILVSVAVNALTILAHDNLYLQSSLNTSDCQLTTYKAARPTCHDNLFSRPASHPYRGANAPALNHPF